MRRCGKELWGLALLLVSFTMWGQPALGQAWIPPAGSGKVKTMVRFYGSHRVFSSGSFSTATYPNHSKLSETQYRIDGEHGLGRGWALMYQLRAAQVTKSKRKQRFSASGLQDQQIGLARGLHQGGRFADALGLTAIIPAGSTSSTPKLGTGAWALEPDYFLGGTYKLRSTQLFASFSLGPRIFVKDGVTQVRASTETGIRPFPRVTLLGGFCFSKTLAGNASTASTTPEAAEFYDILRGGLGLEYAITNNVRPFFTYEADLAGQKIHAGSRWAVGISWHY